MCPQPSLYLFQVFNVAAIIVTSPQEWWLAPPLCSRVGRKDTALNQDIICTLQGLFVLCD